MVGLLVVKVGLGDDRARLAAAGVVLAGLALAIGVAAHRRSGAVAQPLAGRDPLPGGGVLALAAGYTAALGLVALGLTLVSAFAG